MGYYYSIEKMRRLYVWMLLIWMVPFVGWAQSNVEIRGIVTDKNEDPLIGATVILKGTTQGTVTEMDGTFQIETPERATLIISSIGYSTREVPVKPGIQMHIVLKTRVSWSMKWSLWRTVLPRNPPSPVLSRPCLPRN